MLHPTIDELTKDKFNRYELALATARCARIITDEYVRQHDAAERSLTGNKETDRPINTMIDRELRDEKAVKVAINRLYIGEYQISRESEMEASDDQSNSDDAVSAETGDAPEADASDLSDGSAADA